jgi:hypothetical protein
MGEAPFPNRPFKPSVERSSRSTLTAHIWGYNKLCTPVYGGHCLFYQTRFDISHWCFNHDCQLE